VLGSWAIDAPIVVAAATRGRQSAIARSTCATPPHTDEAEPLTLSASHAVPAATTLDRGRRFPPQEDAGRLCGGELGTHDHLDHDDTPGGSGAGRER